jgi:uncharacterized protein YigA (DUF484 family)
VQDRDLERELLRARDRLHRLEKSEVAIIARVQRNEKRIDDLVPRVEALARADEIADAVAHAMANRRGLMLTRWQKWVAIGGGLAVAASEIVRVVTG